MHAFFARRRRSPATVHVAIVFALALAVPPMARAAQHPGRPARPTPLNDANILAIVLSDNDGEIALAALALGRSADPGVKALARRAEADHSASNERTKALALRLGLHPVHNATSRGLVRSAESKRVELAELRGVAFDRAWADAEIARHQEVLALFDQKLIPAAQSVDLRGLLSSLRPTVATHLVRARALRARLEG